MLGRYEPVMAYGCNCGGSGGKQSGSRTAGQVPSGPAAPGYTSTKREAPTWTGPTRRRSVTPPTKP